MLKNGLNSWPLQGVYTRLNKCFASLLLLVLVGCVTQGPTAPSNGNLPNTPFPVPPPAPLPPAAPIELGNAEAERLAAAGDFAGAAEAWQAKAEASDSPARDEYLVLAADYYFAAGQFNTAKAMLRQVNRQALSTAGGQHAQLIDANLLLAEGRPLEALAVLPTDVQGWPPQNAEAAYWLRGQARLQTGQLAAGLQDLVQRERFLTAPAEINANHVLIWTELMQASATELQQAQRQVGSSVLIGWFELARIGQREWLAPNDFEPALQAWRQRYVSHPAGYGLMNDLIQAHRARQTHPPAVALILPLTGRFAAAGRAVRDGFMAAYYQGQQDQTGQAQGLSEQNTALELRIYDSGDDDQTASQAYTQAMQAGAQFVVGPLRKSAVDRVLDEAGRLVSRVPLLALNYRDQAIAAVAGQYQFGLLPEGEAEQVAERASVDGHRQALVLVPSGERGSRLAGAFTQAFVARGGAVVGSAQFEGDKSDHSAAIESMLQLKSSERRHRALVRLLGTAMEYEPRRRQDVDFVFLAANPKQARAVKPQLKFHRAGSVPVYATSSVYTGIPQPSLDADLNGIVFSDMPWQIDAGSEYQNLRADLQQLWPQAMAGSSRLYALGFDAYRLVPLLQFADDGIPWYFSGATGVLSLGERGRIRRDLSWAVFRRGQPEPAPVLAPTVEEPLEVTADYGQ